MEPESKKGLFVRNLPYCTTVEKLKEIFSHYGETKACCIIKDKEGGMAKLFSSGSFYIIMIGIAVLCVEMINIIFFIR